MLKECFTTNDKVLVGRPASNAGIYLGYNNAAFGFADYGPYWRNIRKLVLLEVLSSKRLEQFKRVRIIEVLLKYMTILFTYKIFQLIFGDDEI